MKKLLPASLIILFQAAQVLAQSPFEGATLDTSTSATAASSSGTLADGGMTINYSISGVTELKNLKFSQLQAWNLPGKGEFEAKPSAPAVSFSGSAAAESTGSPERDALPHFYRIMYWYFLPGRGNEMHTLIEKTVHRPFAENYSFQVPVKEGAGHIGVQVLLQEDPDPRRPMNPSVALSLTVKLMDPPAAPEWQSATGSGSSGLKAVAAAAAVIAVGWALRRRKLLKGRKPPEDPRKEPAGYILQLSSERLTLAAGENADVVLTVWRVDGAGGYCPAPEAEISVEPESLTAGFSCAPAQGHSPLTCRLSQSGDPQQRSLKLLVNAQAGESRYSRQISVEFERYEVEFF